MHIHVTKETEVGKGLRAQQQDRVNLGIMALLGFGYSS